jgi:hypothetical protein
MAAKMPITVKIRLRQLTAGKSTVGSELGGPPREPLYARSYAVADLRNHAKIGEAAGQNPGFLMPRCELQFKSGCRVDGASASLSLALL